jgi:peptidoglycan/xylan/chitin deacetylase (PgdA/CDA1 family)
LEDYKDKEHIMIKTIHNIISHLKDWGKYYIFQERYPLLNYFYRYYGKGKNAKGCVIMLHRVCERINGHIPNNEHLKVSPNFLEKVIVKYKKAGFSFFSLDQLHEVISGKINIDKPFVCFTMDDGYLDNYENAYPIFKKHHVPFALFVATDFPDKKAILWWYAIEDLILNSTEIELSDGSKYTCRTFQEKWDTFRFIREKVLLLNPRDIVNELNKLFVKYNMDWHTPIRSLSMSWEHIKALTQEPLCTIGGHTVSHVALNKLSMEDMDREISNGMNIIKFHTGYEPKYFAYPYGSEKENGEREYHYIKNSDIKMAFISYGGFIYPDCQLEQVPRFMLK